MGPCGECSPLLRKRVRGSREDLERRGRKPQRPRLKRVMKVVRRRRCETIGGRKVKRGWLFDPQVRELVNVS